MSGIIGHTTYAILTLREALRAKLQCAPLCVRHYSSFIAGAYLGSDVQTTPAVTCTENGKDSGYGSANVYIDCPGAGAPSRPWRLKYEGKEYSPSQIHEMFYGRAHLVFGWHKRDESLTVPWDHLPEYFGACIADAVELYGPSERNIAYLLGWVVHVASDCLIKSFQPGLSLQLLDGTYTPKNRPIQDLFAFHEIGRKELRLDWAATLADAAATPVEPAQTHAMRVAAPRGELGKLFGQGWQPERQELLLAVLAENRRWLKHHAIDEMNSLKLEADDKGKLDAQPSMRQKTGLSFEEMMALAREKGLREQIGRIATESTQLFAAIEQRYPRLRTLSSVPF